ncbi:MAG: LysE family transporter [Pseudomonadota bacterium]
MHVDIHLSGILLAYSMIVIGVLSPGPAVLAVIGTALERGREPAVYLSAGVVCGSALWGTAAALGMSAILTKYAYALYLVKIVGGLYLLWLAWKSFRSVMSAQEKAMNLDAKRGNAKQMWFTGFLLHLTNPKAVIAWIATIALGVTETSPAWVSFVIVIGGITLSALGHIGYAFLFSTDRMTRVYAKARRPIAFVFSALFGFAGLKLLTSRA